MLPIAAFKPGWGWHDEPGLATGLDQSHTNGYGMTEDGYVPVKPKTIETRFPDVYAVGDCARHEARELTPC